MWEDLNGQNYNDLQKKKLSAAITRRFVPAVVILKESSSQVKYDVFDRLNTGGVIAVPMEIRNAVFPGAFNKLIRTLAELPEFRRLWGIPVEQGELEKNRIYRDMSDIELVLRFFALSEYGQMDMKFKDYLGDFMDRRNKEYVQNQGLAATDTERFRRAVENCWTVFGGLAQLCWFLVTGRLNWHGVGRRRSKSRFTMESAHHSVLGVWVKPGSISNWNVLGVGMVSLSEPRNCKNNVPFF